MSATPDSRTPINETEREAQKQFEKERDARCTWHADFQLCQFCAQDGVCARSNTTSTRSYK